MPPWMVEECTSAKELVELTAFYKMEPFGSQAEDWRFAKLWAVHTGRHPLEGFPGHDQSDIDESEIYLAKLKVETTRKTGKEAWLADKKMQQAREEKKKAKAEKAVGNNR